VDTKNTGPIAEGSTLGSGIVYKSYGTPRTRATAASHTGAPVPDEPAHAKLLSAAAGGCGSEPHSSSELEPSKRRHHSIQFNQKSCQKFKGRLDEAWIASQSWRPIHPVQLLAQTEHCCSIKNSAGWQCDRRRVQKRENTKTNEYNKNEDRKWLKWLLRLRHYPSHPCLAL
jgi:hypothetical protein